jgi:plastocyanin
MFRGPGLALLFLLVLGARGADPATFRIALKTAKGEPVADAAVSLVPAAGTVPAADSALAEVMQRGQQFSPYVTVVQAGGKVVFPNKDDVQHHVYSLSKAKKFELPLYAPGATEAIAFDQPGLVTLGCNIHDWMVAYIVVVPTPWFGKSGADGRAEIRAPAGRYKLEVWHPRLNAPLSLEVVLSEEKPMALEQTLALKSDRRPRRAPDAKGPGY